MFSLHAHEYCMDRLHTAVCVCICVCVCALTASLGSLNTQVLSSVAAFKVLKLVSVRQVEVDLKAFHDGRDGQLHFLLFLHLPTQLPAQLHDY